MSNGVNDEGHFQGTLLHNTSLVVDPIGYFSENWIKSDFKVFKGTLNLKN